MLLLVLWVLSLVTASQVSPSLHSSAIQSSNRSFVSDIEHVGRQGRQARNNSRKGNRRNRKGSNGKSRNSKSCLKTGMSWRSYHSSSVISNYVDCLASSNRDLVTLYNIGTSVEGRVIKAVKVSTGGSGKKAIFIDGGIHAREWISPATVTGLLRDLVENRQSYSSLLKSLDLYLVPLLNPDGYEYSRKTDRLWRKNRSHPERGQCAGVDLNRNFSYKWGGRGSSSNTCSEEYRGQRAFSEPETAALRKFLTQRRSAVEMYLTFHSYGQMILYPWGYDSRAVPVDKAELHSMGLVGARAMSARYKVGPAAVVNYVASGASDDWAKGGLGIKYSYTIELPDTGRHNFILPANRISPTVRDAVRAVKAMAKELIRRSVKRSSS